MQRSWDQSDAEFDSSDSEEEEEMQNELVSPFKQRVGAFVSGTRVTIFMTLVTLYALFGDDVRVLSGKETDIYFTIFSSGAFFIFILEMFLQCYSIKGYFTMPTCSKHQKPHLKSKWARFRQALMFGSFYFWLDLISTLSLIPEISWIYSDGSSTFSDDAETARAGRASRAGAKAGRVVRMVRVIRVLKLYKAVEKQRKNRHAKVTEEETGQGILPKESRVGAQLSELTTRIVIVGILFMLVVIPLFIVTFSDESNSIAIQFAHSIAENAFPSFDTPLVSDAVDSTKDALYPMVYLAFGEHVAINDVTLRDSLRDSDISKFLLIGEKFTTEGWYSKHSYEEEEAYLSICLTLVVIMLLAIMALLFSHDASRLVLNPLERMVAAVKKISQNPLSMPEECEDKQQVAGTNETDLLLTILKKVSGLLTVGFGEAGAAIIASQLNTRAELDPIRSGRRVNAIFGFIIIRDFSTLTDMMQADVMLFVNQVAAIVHGQTVKFGGAANKNIGDAFLLTWKAPEDSSPTEGVTLSPEQKDKKDEENLRTNHTADKALMAFLKIIAQVSRSQREFTFSPEVQNKLKACVPRFKVKMGFGLHYGWAIEGAIGSDKKIDASYLSPNVNTAARLEAATGQYGVPILMSEQFFNLLSITARQRCRLIDRVTFKGSARPTHIYTHDADTELDMIQANGNESSRRLRKSTSFSINSGIGGRIVKKVLSRKRSMRHFINASSSQTQLSLTAHSSSNLLNSNNNNNNDLDSQTTNTSVKTDGESTQHASGLNFTLNMWDTDHDFKTLLSFSTPEFRGQFNKGIFAFLGRPNRLTKPGKPVIWDKRPNWKVARKMFQKTVHKGSEGNDVPSQILLDYMRKHNFECPEEFKAFRPLTRK